MLNITNNTHLLKKYDIMQLMVAQNIINEIESQLEQFVVKWIKNVENVKNIRIHIWVNELLYDILTTYKRVDLETYHNAFQYQLNFEVNYKMKDGEYKLYGVAITVEDKYK